MSEPEHKNSSAEKSELSFESSDKKKNLVAEVLEELRDSTRLVERESSRTKFDIDGLFAVPFFAVLAGLELGSGTLKGFALFGVYLLVIAHHAHILGFSNISFVFRILTMIASHAIAFWLIYAFFSHLHITAFFEDWNHWPLVVR